MTHHVLGREAVVLPVLAVALAMLAVPMVVVIVIVAPPAVVLPVVLPMHLAALALALTLALAMFARLAVLAVLHMRLRFLVLALRSITFYVSWCMQDDLGLIWPVNSMACKNFCKWQHREVRGAKQPEIVSMARTLATAKAALETGRTELGAASASPGSAASSVATAVVTYTRRQVGLAYHSMW
jgi:hypothetical protein